MKKIIFTLTILFSLNGFSQFGIKVNYASYNLKASFEGISADETADGFGIGLDYAFDLGKTKLITGLNADFLSNDGDGETVITPSAVIRYPIGKCNNDALIGSSASDQLTSANPPLKPKVSPSGYRITAEGVIIVSPSPSL